jgi:hypothetical protein
MLATFPGIGLAFIGATALYIATMFYVMLRRA